MRRMNWRAKTGWLGYQLGGSYSDLDETVMTVELYYNRKAMGLFLIWLIFKLIYVKYLLIKTK